MAHTELAEEFVADEDRARWHDQALWFVRAKRDAAAREVPEWEELRCRAAAIKRHAAAHLADYLEQFESEASARGAQVHWARDAAEHNRIVHGILAQRGAKLVAKSKSMLTEECGLNPYLAARGIRVVDTDLGERIVQLRAEPPSHIVLPAIHLRREEVGELFHRELGTPAGLADPERLTAAARSNLRSVFLEADAGITGVNFAVAETGGIVVCTNEGNADLGTSIPKLHIACMGIEKIVPRAADLAVFTRLLARSATGQAITSYTAHMHGPRPGAELHIVLVDNGRSQLLATRRDREVLSCIRCGACLNTCPVYRRSGGYSYESVVPGPVGSVLGAASEPEAKASLPYACTMCGSCNDVCPVRIDLRGQLFRLRQDLVESGLMPRHKRVAARLASWLMRSPRRFGIAGKVARWVLRRYPNSSALLAADWTAARELPRVPERSFRELYEQRERERRR